MKKFPSEIEHITEFMADQDLAALRKDLMWFACLQLRDNDLAEDAVQEALAAALAAKTSFEYRSSFRTWVFSILKNKIIDLLRNPWNSRRIQPAQTELGTDDFDSLFSVTNGHWNANDRPSAWGDPEHQLENKQFWQVLQGCMERLPTATAQVFMLREVFGLEVKEICKKLSISSSNCSVMLYRSRMALRLCLQSRWFQEIN